MVGYANHSMEQYLFWLEDGDIQMLQNTTKPTYQNAATLPKYGNDK